MNWKDNLLKIDPYVAGEQPKKSDYIKLNANENPYPPSPRVTEAIKNFDGSALNKYPSAECVQLAEALVNGSDLTLKNILIGNGSDDVLTLCFRAFFNSELPIIFPDITYSFYPVWCELLKIHYETIPADKNFNIRPDDFKRPNGGVVICNPNAPTSIGRDLDFIREILEYNSGSIVIVDEAYIDFGGESALPLLKDYENLVITRTFSKSRSMAGMRIGYALGNEEVISVLYSVKNNSYPLDSVSIAAGTASVLDDNYFREIIAKIKCSRSRLSEKLIELGFSLPESAANFVFAEHNKKSAKEIFGFLKSRGIYVRYFNKPRIDNRLRITIGTDEQNNALINALKDFL